MPMNESVAANFSDMQAAASQFNNSVSQLEQMLSQIQNQITQLGATWVGQGNQAFTTLMTTWHGDVTKLNQTLSEISAQVNRSSSTYQEADQGVARGFQAG